MNPALRVRSALTCLFALGLCLSISAAQILAALLLIDWAFNAYRRPAGERWKRAHLGAPIVIFTGWALTTAIVHGTANVRDALSAHSSFLLFFWAAQTLDNESARRFFRWLCLGTVLAGLQGILQSVSGVNYLPVERVYSKPEFFDGWPLWIIKELALNNERAVGPRNHPLTFAESFIPGFFLLLGWLVFRVREQRASIGKSLLIAAGLGVVVAGILLAQGRAVWLGIGFGILVFGMSQGRKFCVKTILSLAAALVIVGVASPRMRGRLMSVATVSGGTLGDQQSKSMRYALWRDALTGIREHPVAGIGLEGTRLINIDPVLNRERVWTETHNLYLQFALELGLVGLGLFLWILVLIARMIYLSPARWRPAFAGLFAAFLVSGLTESWPKDKEVDMLFWTMIGALAALRRHEEA